MFDKVFDEGLGFADNPELPRMTQKLGSQTLQPSGRFHRALLIGGFGRLYRVPPLTVEYSFPVESRDSVLPLEAVAVKVGWMIEAGLGLKPIRLRLTAPLKLVSNWA